MAFGTRIAVFFFFFLTFLILCSAASRNPILFSNDDDEAWSIVRRSLKTINLEDYAEETANPGHDPWKGSCLGDHAGPKGRTACN